MSDYWDHAKGFVICALLAAAPLVGWLWGIGAALVPFVLALAGIWWLTVRSRLTELDEDFYLVMSRHRSLGGGDGSG